MATLGAGRRIFVGKDLQSRVPRLIHKKAGGSARRIQISRVLCCAIQKDERVSRIARNFGGYGTVLRDFRTVETGKATGRFLNARAEEPAPGPRQRVS